MMNGIDTPCRISPATAAKITDDFVCLYLVPEHVSYLKKSMAWKRMTKSDAAALTAAGKWILSVFESTAQRAREGKEAGKYDGRMALQEAKLVGQPPGSVIYFAVDYDAPGSDVDAIYEYLIGTQSEIPGYTIGVYGSYAVAEAMAKRGIKHHWQTYAWSHGKLSQYANVYQYRNGTNLFGLSTDSNYSYGGEGFWNLNGILKSEKEVIMDWNQKAVDFVTYFQKQTGLVVDGKAGANTVAKLDEVIIGNAELKSKVAAFKEYYKKGESLC